MSAERTTRERAATVTREAGLFRLAFPYDRELVRAAKLLPYATYDPGTKTWTCLVCDIALERLQRMGDRGQLAEPVDLLVGKDEELPKCPAGALEQGTDRRPYRVRLAVTDTSLFGKLSGVPGSFWGKKGQMFTFPAAAAGPLADFVLEGTLTDSGRLLFPAETMVVFDIRTGEFSVLGPDVRAQAGFDRHFPQRDIVHAWKQRGLDVAFMDQFTEEMYRGELARHSGGLQPDGLTAELYPFQAQHVSVAVERSGYGVFDAPGLGKTVTGIATGVELLKRGVVSRVVVVVPPAVRSQWKAEIIRYTGCSPDDVAVVSGDADSRDRAYRDGETCPWLVVHYNILATEKKKLAPLFSGSLVIADEAHRLKNYRAARTKAMLELSRRANRRLALTGTPTERNPSEFYQVLSGFTCPGVLGAPDDFNGRYRRKTKFGYEGARNLPELRRRTRRYYGRNVKSQVAKHLPALQVNQIVLDPEPQYARALERAHQQAAKEVKQATLDRLGVNIKPGDELTLIDKEYMEQASSGADMTAVTMLRLLCSSPRLVANSDADAAKALAKAGLIPDEDGPKLDELRVMACERKAVQDEREHWMQQNGIDTADPAMVTGERMVVFSFSKRMANLIAERLDEDGVSNVLFTGDTSANARAEAVRRFTDPNSGVTAFIATDAAAEGLNLGRCCSTLVNVDLPWTPSKLTQRSNRIHRLDGQSSKYSVVNLTISGTMEVYVARLLEHRGAVADAILGEAGGRGRTVGQRTPQSLLKRALEPFLPKRSHAQRPNRGGTNIEGSGGAPVLTADDAPVVDGRQPALWANADAK